jgi:hypothetical protein
MNFPDRVFFQLSYRRGATLWDSMAALGDGQIINVPSQLPQSGQSERSKGQNRFPDLLDKVPSAGSFPL